MAAAGERWPYFLAGGVIGAAVAAGVSYFMTASALAALADERALRRAEDAAERGGGSSSSRHGRHGKHTAPTVSAVTPVTPGKHKHSKASEQARRAVASAAELVASRSAGDEDGLSGPEDGDDAEDVTAALGGVVSNPVYAARVLADDALPSRAASRLTAALGVTPDGASHHGANGHVGGSYHARFDDETASGEEADGGEGDDAVSGLETGLETEEELGARRGGQRRRDIGLSGLRVPGRCSAAVGAAHGNGAAASESDAPLPLLPSSRGSPRRCAVASSASEKAMLSAWSLNASVQPPPMPPPPANALTSAPASGSAPSAPVSASAAASVANATGAGPFRLTLCNGDPPARLAHCLAYIVPPGAALPVSRPQRDVNVGGDYDRVTTPEEALTAETEDVCAALAEALALRTRYAIPEPSPASGGGAPRFTPASKADPFHIAPGSLPPASGHVFAMRDGVMHVWASAAAAAAGAPSCFPVPATATDFFSDLHSLCRMTASGPVKTFGHRRLQLLEQRFSLHLMLNADREFLTQKAAPHRDFYNVRKVDTHVHHSACMNQKHLLRFIKSRLRKEPHGVVIFRDGKYLTLDDVFRSVNLTAYELNVDTLDMHADKDTFHRFDKFNLKYNPCGESRLREIFIKQDNLIRGRYLAELTREVFADLDVNKYQHAEYRISVYGRKAAEWDTLAAWVCNHGLHSHNVVWLIQLPRLYSVYKENGTLATFQEMLDNIFAPLFEVTVDPASHPQLHAFLANVVGFDMVDDESKPERRPAKHMRTPAEWNLVHNPAYAYYAYYVWANLYALNELRRARGLNYIAFRPHAGEAGDIDHLVAAFLLAKNIAHGNNLRKSPGLQYLFYLAQIGLNMSPLSNNSLFLDYHRNPFPTFFARGLPVALSTDDPLQIHMTKEPLVEEYSVAAQVWKLSSCDLCEIARTSVLNSGFPHADKQHWVGDTYWEPGPAGNDIYKTNVPNVRIRFRHDTLAAERALVERGAAAADARRAHRAAPRG